MPIYCYSCSAGHEFERYLPVAHCGDAQYCGHEGCGELGVKQLTAPTIIVSPDVHYTSPVDGREITSMQARRNDLARHNCQPYDEGMKTDYNRRQKESTEALEKSMDETVDREIALMPAVKREKLEAELQHGFAAEPTRLTPAAKSITTEIAK